MIERPLELSSSRVDLWLIPTDLPARTVSFLSSLLTTPERERVAKLLIPAKRLEATVSRGVLRLMLSQCNNTLPQDIELSLGGNGKPHLIGSDIRFNLSHTAGRVLLAVTRGNEIGVDIEQLRPRDSLEDLARRYFTPCEYDALMALPPSPASDRVHAFFTCWTRKESLLKATGQGIAAGLDTFEVPLGPVPTPIVIHNKWSLHDLDVGADYVAAMAVDRVGTTSRWHDPFRPNIFETE